MPEATLPAPARVHVAVARVLDWVWPRGAAWAYADAIAHAPRHPELHFLRGQALVRARRFPDAARSFAEAARLKPSSAEYQGALVVALDRAGDPNGVVEALRRFAELRPGEGEVQVLIGAVLRRCGRKAEALRSFRLAVRLGSLPPTRRFVLGEALLGAEGWQAALAGWNEARQLEAASGSVILQNAGRRSSLNFHPGQPMVRAPRRELAPPKGPLAWVRERREGVRDALRALLRREWGGEGDRVRAIQKAWRKAHPGVAPRKGPAAPQRPVAGPAHGAARAVRRHVVTIALAFVAAAASATEPQARPGDRASAREGAATRGPTATRETAAAREQARLCERENLEAGAAACREALALGIGGTRRTAVREILARHLVALERWDELAELLRENVRLDPGSSAAWQRLGLVVLYGLGESAEAVGALEEAVRLAPSDAGARLGLALALQASLRPAEAVVEIEEALRLDPAVLEGRPAARAALDAARRGEPWP